MTERSEWLRWENDSEVYVQEACTGVEQVVGEAEGLYAEHGRADRCVTCVKFYQASQLNASAFSRRGGRLLIVEVIAASPHRQEIRGADQWEQLPNGRQETRARAATGGQGVGSSPRRGNTRVIVTVWWWWLSRQSRASPAAFLPTSEG